MEQTLNAYEYARVLDNDPLAELVHQRMQLLPFDERFLLVLQLNDSRRCETFLHNLRNQSRQVNLAQNGLFYAAQFGSINRLDYFLTHWKIDIDTRRSLNDSSQSTTALLTAIACDQSEAAKFLIFRHADPNLKGQHGNALVTAVHYRSDTSLIRLLLDKNADLTARHPDYERLTLREFCTLTHRVNAKAELDLYIVQIGRAHV